MSDTGLENKFRVSDSRKAWFEYGELMEAVCHSKLVKESTCFCTTRDVSFA